MHGHDNAAAPTVFWMITSQTWINRCRRSKDSLAILRMVQRWGTITVLCLMLMWTRAAHAQQSQPYAFPSVQCASISLESNDGTCDDTQCVLSDKVRLRCNNLLVLSDGMTVLMGPDRAFGGAVATGNVWLLSGSTLIQCNKVTLGADQIQGKIAHATVHMKEGPVNLQASARTTEQVGGGRDRFVFFGDIDRMADDRLVMGKSDFSMCDCGKKPPSWRLSAFKIEAVPNDRATIWWPIFKIRPLGLFDMPVTPPMLPLSIPLKSRAMGILAPRIALFNSLWPTIDLPFFVPLGPSWDISIIPGLRMDWGEHPHANPTTWGSPRMGARLRYAPYLGKDWSLEGKINGQWTHDGNHWAAKKRQTLARISPFNENDPSWDLRERFSLSWEQQLKAGKSFAWTLKSEWYSDDLIPQDFAMPLAERSRNYIASRTQALWRNPGMAARMAADYYLRLDTTVNAPDCSAEDKAANKCAQVGSPSNLGSAGRGDPNRGPWLSFHLIPTRIAKGFHTDGQVSWVRYGPWSRNATNVVKSDQNLLNAAGGVVYADAFGPVHVHGRAGIDGLLADPNAHVTANMIGTLAAEANMSWMGKTRQWGHVITPRVGYRALPWTWGGLPDITSIDERWQRQNRFHQAMVAVDQEFWKGSGGQWTRFAKLSLTQPLDLATGDLLPPSISLEWQSKYLGSGTLWTSMDWALHNQPKEIPRSVGGRIALPIGPVTLSTNYARMAANATQFLGSIYQFAPARNLTLNNVPNNPSPTATTWVHYVTGDIAINWPKSLSAGYNMMALLPLPGQPNGRADCALHTSGPPSSPPYPAACIASHTVRATYRSPCNCWELGANFTKTAIDYRIGFTVGVGGYSLGTTLAPAY